MLALDDTGTVGLQTIVGVDVDEVEGEEDKEKERRCRPVRETLARCCRRVGFIRTDAGKYRRGGRPWGVVLRCAHAPRSRGASNICINCFEALHIRLMSRVCLSVCISACSTLK